MNVFAVRIYQNCRLFENGGLALEDLRQIIESFPSDARLVGFETLEAPGQPVEKPNRSQCVSLTFETDQRPDLWNHSVYQVERHTGFKLVSAQHKSPMGFHS